VSIDIFFGQAQYGEYLTKLYDENGQNSNWEKTGNNIDNKPDTYELPEIAATLVNKTFSWFLTIATPSVKEGEFYFARLTFSQGDTVLDDLIEYSGELKDTKVIVGVAKFESL